jgi:hypothetical protein
MYLEIYKSTKEVFELVILQTYYPLSNFLYNNFTILVKMVSFVLHKSDMVSGLNPTAIITFIKLYSQCTNQVHPWKYCVELSTLIDNYNGDKTV